MIYLLIRCHVYIFRFISSLLLIFSNLALAEGINCNDYKVTELKVSCNNSHPSSAYIYDQVGESDLNDLADDWSTESQSRLRVIPPGRYILRKPITLLENNRIIPHPTMPIPAGSLRTIELIAGPNFQPASDFFYLVNSTETAYVCGLEIHGSSLPDNLISHLNLGSLENPRNTLVLTSGDTDISMVGSVLTGHEKLDCLYLNTAADPDKSYYDNERGVRIERNYLKQAGAKAAVILSIPSSRPYTIRNNTFFVEPGQTTADSIAGIHLGGGSLKAELSNNDFILPSMKTAAEKNVERRAIEIGRASGFSVKFNAIYTPGATTVVASDTGIYDTRSKTSARRVMEFTGNSFSPYITPLRANLQGTAPPMKISLGSLTANPSTEAYHLSPPQSFMDYQFSLGAIPQTASVFISANNVSDNVTCTDSTLISDDILKQQSFSLTSDFIYDQSEPCSGNRYTSIGAFQIFLSLIIPAFTIASSIACGICLRRSAAGVPVCKCHH